MTYAKIINGVVTDIKSTNVDGSYVFSPPPVQIGWRYSNNTFTPNPSNTYNVQNWYWNVGASTTQVYSSAARNYVPVTDATYITWAAQGNTAIPVAAESDLIALFAAQYPAGWPPTPAQVAREAAAAAMVAGIQISSVSTPAINSTYALTDSAQIYINGIMACILATNGFFNGASTQVYFDISGNAKVFPSTTVFKDFALAVGDYINAVTQYALSGGTIGRLPSNQIAIA